MQHLLYDIIRNQEMKIERLKAENAALREDKARLDWLEQAGFATRQDAPKAGVHSWRLDESTWRWTAQGISSEFTSARKAIDAARSSS